MTIDEISFHTNILALNAAVDEIISSGREQARGIKQISTAMNQIGRVTQINADHAKKSANASEQFASQASRMESSVLELLE